MLHLLLDSAINPFGLLLMILFSRNVVCNLGEVYSLPSINVNPLEWIKVNIYRGVNS